MPSLIAYFCAFVQLVYKNFLLNVVTVKVVASYSYTADEGWVFRLSDTVNQLGYSMSMTCLNSKLVHSTKCICMCVHVFLCAWEKECIWGKASNMSYGSWTLWHSYKHITFLGSYTILLNRYETPVKEKLKVDFILVRIWEYFVNINIFVKDFLLFSSDS